MILMVSPIGSNFGSNPSVVNITVNNTRHCMNPQPAETILVCTVGGGQGLNLPLRVMIEDLAVTSNLFSYDGTLT